MQFSKEEIRDIVIAIAGLIIILVIKPLPSLGIDLSVLPAYLLGIVLGFILHELAHKAMANRLGAEALFKLWPQGIVIGLLFSLVSSLKFLALGAVVVYGQKFGRWKYRLDRLYTTPHGANLGAHEMGLISIAGPVVNIILAFVFLSIPGELFKQVAFINSYLAVFNLIPVPPLDGSKIMLWNGVIWLFVMILAAVPLISLLV